MKKSNNKIVIMGVLIFAFALTASLAFAKSDNNKGGKSGEKSSPKSAQVKSEIKSFEKANNLKSNAQIHREKIGTVVNELEEAAKRGKMEKDKTQKRVMNLEGEEMSEEEVAEKIEDIAEDTEEEKEDAVDTIGKVEKRSKFKTAIIGSDYKNLGQLRSTLRHYEVQVRRLVQLHERTGNPAIQDSIDEQLMLLMQERTRIKEVIDESEQEFNLFGWLFRFINGYPDDPIDNENEAELEEEVGEVIGDDEVDCEEGAECEEEDLTGEEGTDENSNTEEGTETEGGDGEGETETETEESGDESTEGEEETMDGEVVNQ